MRIRNSIQNHPMYFVNYVDPFNRHKLVLVFLCFTVYTVWAYILTYNHISPTPTVLEMEPIFLALLCSFR